MITIITYLLLFSACAFTLYPLFRKAKSERTQTRSAREKALSDLHWQAARIRNTLTDLELDFQTGKLSEQDFNDLVRDQERRLEDVDQQTKELTGVETDRIVARLEKQIGAERKPRDENAATKLVCTKCGQEISSQDKFCSNCGTKIKQN